MPFDAATDRRLRISAPCAVPEARRVIVPVADLRPVPDVSAGLDTQLLRGAAVKVHEELEGWALVQAGADGYCGWLAASALGPDETPTHRVTAPRSFLYPGPDMKLPHVAALSIGSAVRVMGEAETRGTAYALLADGTAMVARHLAPMGDTAADPVAIAESLPGTPYLWGGASAFGIDCSGLVQLSHAMCGIPLLRDTDMQAATAGAEIGHADLARGDLVFWKGHVAMMQDERRIIHASGAAMLVVSEGLAAAIDRIAPLYGPPLGFRRPSLA
jgi:cell wall-associated NlpC family hydrolase